MSNKLVQYHFICPSTWKCSFVDLFRVKVITKLGASIMKASGLSEKVSAMPLRENRLW